MLGGLDQVLRAMRVELVLAGLLFSVLATTLLAAIGEIEPRFYRFEHTLSDFRTALLSDQHTEQHPRLAIVLIDEQTLRREPYSSPVDRGLIARLVTKLDSLAPKAIALDIVFYKPTEPAKDEALLRAIRQARATVIMAAGDRRSAIDEEERAFQARFLRNAGRPAGYVNLNRDRDDITRWKLGPATGTEFPKSFAELVAEVDGRQDRDPEGRIAWLKRPVSGADTFFAVKAEDLIGEQPIRAIEAHFKDRLVLIGGRFEDRDRHRVPLFPADNESNSRLVHGVYLHAHMIAQALDGRTVKEVALIPSVFAVALLGFCLGWIFHQQGFNWLVGGLTTGIIIAVDMLLFWGLRQVLPYTPVTIAWFGAAFVGFLLARLASYFQRAPKELT